MNFFSNGKQIYVTSEGTSSVVIIIDVNEKEILNEILVGNRPRRGLFVNNGLEYWVSNELSGSVGVIDTTKQELKKTIKFSIKGIRNQITPVDFAYAKNKNLVFVTLGNANHVAVVDANTYEIKKYILVGSRVWGADITSDEKELVVTNGNSDDISIIDLNKLVSTSAIPVGKTPHSVKIIK